MLLEYIWIDGDGNLRSKTKVFENYVHNNELGLSVSDDFVAEKLKNIKVFQTLNKFDEKFLPRLRQFLNQSRRFRFYQNLRTF